MLTVKRVMPLGFVLSLVLAAAMNAHAAEEMRLPAVKNFCLDTVLVSNGAAMAAIVAPDDPGYACLARELCQAVGNLTGTELPVLPDVAADAELRAAGGQKRAIIVLGNLMTSKVSERLYCMEQLDVDAGWPGKNGYLVQTVHNPMGDGRNFISLGGSDFKGVQSAVQAFIELLKPEGKSLKVGRLFRLKSRDQGPAPLTAADVNRKGYVAPEHAGNHAMECGFILRKYRTPGYARMFRHAVERIALAFRNREKFDEIYPSFTMLPLLWDIIEEDEAFDERDTGDTFLMGEALPGDDAGGLDAPKQHEGNDRTFISNVLYDYAHMLMYARQNTGDQGPGGNNHHAVSALHAGLYFARYYPDLEIGRRLVERMNRYFEQPIKHWRVSDNALGYGDYTWFANLQYSLLRPDMTYFSSGMVRKAADYHIVITSNCGRSGGFGDSLSWSKMQNNYHPVMLPMAAWYYRDGSYLWWFKHCGGKPDILPKRYGGTADVGRYIVNNLAEAPPVRWLGVKPFPLDHWLYGYLGAPKPEAEHASRYFDKMSFRAGFDPTNQYLLLSGFSGGYHGHPDGNAIILFSDNGCDFLDDSGYMMPDITEHNTLIIRRNGMGGSLPGLARLDHFADFNDVAFTETLVTNYNGVSWARNIIWEKERYFAFVEEIEAEEDGQFGLNCIWRTQGAVGLSGREMTAKQREQTLHLINLGGTRQTLEHLKYCQRLVQTLNAGMKKGQKAVIANLFFVKGPKESLSIGAERVAPGAVLVKQAGEYSLLGIGPCRGVAGLETDAALFHVGPRVVYTCGTTRLALPGYCNLQADKPVSFFLDLEKGTGIVEAAESVRVVLSTGAEMKMSAGPGRTAFQFEPSPRTQLEERKATLAGLFAATAVARERNETQAQAASQAEARKLKSRISVLWESRDFQAAGFPKGKPETKDLLELIEKDKLADLNDLKEDGFARVGDERSEEEGKTEIRWIETADRDGDGKSEILVATASGFITALSPAGKPLWSTPTISLPGLRGMDSALRAVIGGPGDRRIIVASGHGAGFLSCIDADGARLWEVPLPVVPQVLFASDPDAVGEFQIGIAAFEYAYGFSHQGKSLWKFMNQEKHDSTCGAAFDIDGDGTGEMIVGNDYYSAHLVRGKTGGRLMSIGMTGHAGPSAVAMGDIDGDGKGDFVIGDRMGHLVFCVPWNTKDRISRELAATVTFVKLADLEGDGEKEIFVGTDSGVVHAFDAGGRTLFHGNVDAIPRDIDFGDVDGNGRLDLLVDCADNCMRILDDTGRQTALFTTGGGMRFVRVVELDGNRRVAECVVGGNDGCVYALRFDAAGGK
ncbi:MAG: FG-GAP-like repeat-containing protein [Kiritimatiellae bacterium]|nr:FG-GAP-like repeat-containing protein [Kiritimatiellia bacterium]